MKRIIVIREGIFTLSVIVAAFIINLIIQEVFYTRILIPMIFVLGTYIVALKTKGYFWGITA